MRTSCLGRDGHESRQSFIYLKEPSLPASSSLSSSPPNSFLSSAVTGWDLKNPDGIQKIPESHTWQTVFNLHVTIILKVRPRMRKRQLEGEEAETKFANKTLQKTIFVVWEVSPRLMALSSFRYSLGTTEQQKLGDEGGHKRCRFPREPILHTSADVALSTATSTHDFSARLWGSQKIQGWKPSPEEHSLTLKAGAFA